MLKNSCLMFLVVVPQILVYNLNIFFSRRILS